MIIFLFGKGGRSSLLDFVIKTRVYFTYLYCIIGSKKLTTSDQFSKESFVDLILKANLLLFPISIGCGVSTLTR